MDIKEAIEFDYINFLKSIKEFVTRKFHNPPGKKDINKRIDEIIKLLRRGGKYEAIVKELNNKYGNINHCHPIQNERFGMGNETILYLSEIIKELEQKYFLKPEKKIDWKDKFYGLEEESEEAERELKWEIEHWKTKYYNKGKSQ